MPSNLPRLVTRVPEDINDKFLEICKQENRTASNLLSIIVREYVSNYNLNSDKTESKKGKSDKSSTLKTG